ncbi:MAG: DegT/DnrJ/EryC1/StrS family aminotransferase [Candidatus Margulisiibacteriota bacterium]
MSVPFFNITRQNQAVKDQLDQAVAEVIKSGHFILGEAVAAFEKELASFCGTKHAIGVASGTDALHLALRACGVKPGDEVISSPFTFVATAEAISYCGATPVFVDIEPETFNLDPAQIEAKLTKKTTAILPVHLYGQASNMEKILQISQKHGIKVIEDAAQAIGAESEGQKVGSLGTAGCFSFFPTKNLGCFGDGGAITTNDDAVAEEIKVLRGHGSRKTYHYDLIGYNSRLDALQAAVILAKLPYLADFSYKRRKNATFYAQELKDLPEITLPIERPNSVHVYNQYTIRVKNRDKLFGYLKDKGVGAMVYYPLSLHLQKAFAQLGHKLGDFPASEAAQDEVLSLPIFPELTEAERAEAASTIKAFYKK